MFFRRSRSSRKRRQRDIRERSNMLPRGCGYMGRDFGAPYTDSECFGGRLYDLDNGECGRLYEPMEYKPCPECNHELYLAECLEDAEQSGMNDQGRGRPREFIAADKLRYPQDHAALQAAYFKGWDYSQSEN